MWKQVIRAQCLWLGFKKNLVLRRIQFFIWFILPSAKSLARSSEEEEKQWKKSTIIPFLEYLPSTDRPMKDPPRTTYKVCCTTQCMSPCVLYVCVCLDYYGPCVVSIFSIFSHFRLLFSANFSTKIVQSPSNSSSCVFPPTLKKISGRWRHFFNFCLFKQIVKRSRSKKKIRFSAIRGQKFATANCSPPPPSGNWHDKKGERNFGNSHVLNRTKSAADKTSFAFLRRSFWKKQKN